MAKILYMRARKPQRPERIEQDGPQEQTNLLNLSTIARKFGHTFDVLMTDGAWNWYIQPYHSALDTGESDSKAEAIILAAMECQCALQSDPPLGVVFKGTKWGFGEGGKRGVA